MPTSRGECHSSEVRVRLSQSKLFIVRVREARAEDIQHTAQPAQPSQLATDHHRSPTGHNTSLRCSMPDAHGRDHARGPGASHTAERAHVTCVCGGCCRSIPRSHCGGNTGVVEKIWRIAGHDPKHQAIPKHSWHCQHILKRRRESHCA